MGMDESMRTIDEDIKNKKYKKVYLLYGAESYLRNQYKDKLKKALVEIDDTMNVAHFEGKNIPTGEVIDLAETLPFFADRRTILIENSGLFSSEGETLAEYLAAPSDYTVFIFVEETVDKRSRLFKTVNNIGKVIDFETPSPDIMKKWILSILKKDHKSISKESYDLFLEKTGTDMSNISKELEKLLCYTLLKDTITSEDIETICTTKISNKIFDMVDAIAKKRQKDALKMYYDLLSLKEPPMRILFLIARQFNLLMQVKELKENGLNNNTIASKMGLRDFVVTKYATQSNQFRKEALREALEACVNGEELIKTGKMNDVMCVELIIISYSQ